MKLQIKTIGGSVLFESEAESLRELIIGAVKNRANLSGANLSGADLSRADLSGADLSGADLSGADLSGAIGILPSGIIPLQILGSRHALIVRQVGHITIGCEHHQVEWWKEHFRALGRREQYTKEQVNEYRNYIALAEYWMKTYGVLE